MKGIEAEQREETDNYNELKNKKSNYFLLKRTENEAKIGSEVVLVEEPQKDCRKRRKLSV